MGGRLSRREAVLAAILALPLALLFTSTQVFPLDGIPVMGTDYGQMVWNLWSVDRSIAMGRSPLSTDLVFHPIGTSLAAHVLTPGFFPVATLARLLRGGDDLLYPIVAYKASIALGYALLAFSTFAFLRRIGALPLSALSATLTYAFSPFAMLHAPHLNHLAVAALLPLAAWCLVSAWEKPRFAPGFGLALVFGLGPYFGELIVFAWAAFLAISVAVLALPAWRLEARNRLRVLGGTRAAAAFLIAAIFVAPFALAWLKGGAQPMNARQAGFWSANLAAFVIPDPAVQPALAVLAPLHRMIRKGVAGHEAFLGYVLLASSLFGVLRIRDFWNRLCFVVAMAFLVLSLGPTLKVFSTETGLPLPYSFLMSVPPFSMGRTPVRCVLFALFFLAIPAARGLSSIEGRGTRGRAMVAIVVALAGIEMWSPRPRAERFESPLDLSKLVPGGVCNIPLTTLDGFAVLLQTQHRRPIVTGLVSRRSQEIADHVNRLGDLLDHDPAAFAQQLLAWNVTNVILEPGAPDGLEASLPALGLNVIDLRGSGGRVQ